MRLLQKTLAALVFGVVLTSLSVIPAGAAESPRPESSVARVNVGPAGVDWSPVVDYERLVLTVAGPGGLFIRREFDAGESPFFSSLDVQGGLLPDGSYAYELRAVSRHDAVVNETRPGRRLPEGPLVQWGHLWVQEGSFVDKVPSEPNPSRRSASASKPPSNVTANTTIPDDLIVEEDLIVDGHACIGSECEGAVTSAPLTIKDFFNYQILFDGGGFHPAKRKWVLQANDLTDNFGGFLFRDVFAGTIPFRIGSNVPDNALTIWTNGNVGLGTLTPAQDIHAMSGNTPTLRLEQDTSGGLSARTWDIGANNTKFFVKDVTGSSNEPLRVQAGAPTSSIEVASSGNVGIGTASPSVPLHVSRSTGAILEGIRLSNNNEARISIQNTGLAAAPKYHLAVNNTAPGLFFISRDGGGGSIVEINQRLDASGVASLKVNGSIQATNVVFTSSQALKKDFQPLDPQDVLTRVAKLPISEWSFKEGPDGVRHIGPMAEDFHHAFNLSSDQHTISVTDTSGVALAAIQALLQRVEDLEKKNAEMAEHLKALELIP